MTEYDRQRNSATLRRSARQWFAFAITMAAATCALVHSAAAQDLLACGVPVTRHLESGQIDRYQPVVSSQLPVVVDVTDASGTIGLLQLKAVDSGPPDFESCNGSLAFQGGPVEVSDCVGADTGDYTVELNVVSQSPENCGVPLTCGVAPANTALNVAGQVDAYTFAGVAFQHVSLTVAPTSDTTGSLRMRLFSFSGELQSDSCSGAVAFDVPYNGTYTVLVSACVTPSTGPYTIIWQTQGACPSASQPAFAYMTSGVANTVGVIDLATNRVVSIVPPPFPVTPTGAISAIIASPNNGLLYASFDTGTVSVINTTLNRLTGSINLPVATVGSGVRLALDPAGRYAYANAAALRGVAVINVATLKIEAVIPLENINIPAQAPIAVSPDGKSVYVPAFTLKEQTPVDTYRLELIALDTTTRTVAGRVTLDDNFHEIVGRGDTRFVLDISPSPSGTLVYVTDLHTLYVVDTATRAVTRSLPLPFSDNEEFSDLVVSRDGHVAYAVSIQPGVLVIDLDSLTITNTILVINPLNGEETGGAALSPDGGRLVVTGRGSFGNSESVGGVVIDTRTLQVVATIPPFADSPSDVVILTPPSGLCAADDTGQTRVTVGELVTAVNYAVDGCPTARLPNTP